MLGAIVGDIVGSVYEFNNHKSKDFSLFQERSRFTDDTILTIATADALMTDHDVEEQFGYDLTASVDELRATYQYNETCQGTVPEAIRCFIEAEDFEDEIRNAISIGGDSDTLAAITGSIAEANWGVPEEIRREVEKRLDDELFETYQTFVSRAAH